MANDTGAETQVRSLEDAGAPDSNVNEDTRSPAAADAGASDSAASEDARSPAAAEAGTSDDSAANADSETPPVPDAGAPDSAAGEEMSNPASPAASSGALDQITQIAAQSAIARYSWKDRGIAPKGYIKGMALVYARVYCKLGAGDDAVTEMAKPNSADGAHDALAWYDPIFAAAGDEQ